jgi:ABC-2 type transport system ATP-binding protein
LGRAIAKEIAVRIESVSKAFGGRWAVDRLSLSVPRGGIYGFIGPNGSGKTTTLRMIMNLILPDRGSIEVLGRRGAAAARDHVSYLPEERGLYKKMTVRAVLRYYGLLKGASPAGLDAAIVHWLHRLDLSAWADQKVEALSKGMAQKVQFIAALVSGPELIILDEPFSGLDPGGAQQMKRILRELKAEGRTVIFSTHQMAAAEELCDRIGMIFRGRQVLDGTLAQIRRAHGSGAVRVRTDKSTAFLRALKGVTSVREAEGYQVLQLSGEAQPFLRLLARRAKVRHFELKIPSLNEIFLERIYAVP